MAAACDFGEFPGGCAEIFGSASVGFVVAAWRLGELMFTNRRVRQLLGYGHDEAFSMEAFPALVRSWGEVAGPGNRPSLRLHPRNPMDPAGRSFIQYIMESDQAYSS
jgi:hypothetical protein